MNFSVTRAFPEDSKIIADHWKNFVLERTQENPSVAVKDGFDFEKYAAHQISKPLSFCWLLKTQDSSLVTDHKAVGFLIGNYYDESPSSNLSQDFRARHRDLHPYQYRRIGSVLAFYVEPEHRTLEAIKLLVDAALQHADSMKVSDIDLMVGAHLSGLHALLEKLGFSRTAVQYTRHYDLPKGIDLPNLHPPLPDIADLKPPVPRSLPLRDPKTGLLVKNPQGEPVFLQPLTVESTAEKPQLPLYPTPVRDPQTQSFVFDKQGNLVVCPVLKDENGNIFMHEGNPQFQTPAYQYLHGKLHLKQDDEGNYLFCDAERDADGKALCDSQGKPIFQNPLHR
ncbi:MAG: GNAT family N-acetyltransferase [Cyanobacteria bacterium P01_D01_bin.156]